MRVATRIWKPLLALLAAGLLTARTPADDSAVSQTIVAESRAALRKAVTFFRSLAAGPGGYVWRYSADGSLREGEGAASDTMAWVQPPGTPTIGEAFLDAYAATGDEEYLDAARGVAVALIQGQMQSGGWFYHIELDGEKRQAYAFRNVPKRRKQQRKTTLDDDTTTAAIRFLVRLDKVLEFQDQAVHEAAEYALHSLDAAQYPNGGWYQWWEEPPSGHSSEEFPVLKAAYPDAWPREWLNDWTGRYFLNDNVAANAVSTLLLAHETYGDPRYIEAANRAGDFLILAQMPEPQPAWAQQYDVRMHPVWDRKFEPPAICGGESQGVLETLMKLYRATGEARFLEPLPRALDYLKRSQLPDGRLARFYELQTNRPLYFTRDYELTYDASEVPTHYSFVVGSRLDRIEREFERLKGGGEASNSAAKPDTASRLTPSLAARARQVIDAMDDRGAWVEPGRLKSDRSGASSPGIIQSQTFVDNVRLLCRVVATQSDEVEATETADSPGEAATREAAPQVESARSSDSPASAAIEFSEHIQPILSDRCFACHGPDAGARQADLRLDVRAEAMRESMGEASHIILPGDVNQSELYRRITATDDDVRMPPPDSKLTLTAEEIDLIRRWIEQGAEWSEHWSFRTLRDHIPVPDEEGPDDDNWARNAIDRFVWRRMRERGLKPAAEADRETLIRRLSFDLTGLPPTLEQIDRFLNDTQPGAYERLVDRLLADESYGERMASEWLDVARYADTYGYQVDRDRFVWPWRDWVVRAFNRNLPYDRFITEQLAGDLLPDATDDQILATTFNRLHPQKVEGGSIEEEFRVEYVADRTQTFGTAMLGLTLECARCHDHKFDPVSQREYYQLSAFFDNIDEAGLYSYFTESVPTPTLRLMDEATREKLTKVEAEIEVQEQKTRDVAAEREACFEHWLAHERPRVSPDDAIGGRVAHLDFESEIEGANRRVPGREGHAVKLTGDDGIATNVGNFDRFEPFTVALWVHSPGGKERAVIYHRSAAWTDAGSRGYELLLEEDRLSAALVHFWPGNALRVKTLEPLEANVWTHVTVTYDGSSRAAGLRIYVNGRLAPVEVVRDKLTKNITGGGGDTITIGQRFRDRGFTDGLVDEFQVFDRELTPLEAAQLADGRSLIDALGASIDELTQAQRDGLRSYFLHTQDAPYRAALGELRAKRKTRSEIADPIPEIMVMQEMPAQRPTFVLQRGAYDARGEQVDRVTPANLPPLPPDAPRNRLGLAQWLCDPHHPLTARVAVNRYWQLIFGEGLVRTPEDFGSQGRPPTHPDLLDWLARDFVAHGWDLKRLLKQIVMSATYRQTSQVPASKLEADPENLWLARAPSHRLSAEMLRDNALLVSGLLVDCKGGPPVKPYEVEVAYYVAKPDDGPGVYRRSLYTYWKGNSPAPVMMTLDASKRDVCRMRRERTSSPLQALVMLNSPQFVEAARGLAVRVMREHEENTDAALVNIFRWLTSRRPDEQQLQTIRELYDWQLEHYRTHPADRDTYLNVGRLQAEESLDANRLAALTTVANALLNYHECITKQ